MVSAPVSSRTPPVGGRFETMESEDQMTTISIRLAAVGDRVALRDLQENSLRVLGGPHYGSATIESFIRHVGTMDDYLLEDGTYFVAELDGAIVACGGWTRRRPGYARLDAKEAAAPPAATIRSVFVDPLFARMGVGRRIMAAAEQAVAAAGFDRAELMATLSGARFYRALGYMPGAMRDFTLPDGAVFRCQAMAKPVAGVLTTLHCAA